jgi:hypothetical protein
MWKYRIYLVLGLILDTLGLYFAFTVFEYLRGWGKVFSLSTILLVVVVYIFLFSAYLDFNRYIQRKEENEKEKIGF